MPKAERNNENSNVVQFCKNTQVLRVIKEMFLKVIAEVTKLLSTGGRRIAHYKSDENVNQKF